LRHPGRRVPGLIFCLMVAGKAGLGCVAGQRLKDNDRAQFRV
jgi:hypothetical protein